MKTKTFKNNQPINIQEDIMVLDGYVIREIEGKLINVLKAGEVIPKPDSLLQSSFSYKAKNFTVIIKLKDIPFDYYHQSLKAEVEQLAIKKIKLYLKTMNQTAEKKLNVLLVQLGKDIGTIKNNQYFIPLLFHQTELAQYISISREYLNTIIKDYYKNKLLIKKDGYWIFDYNKNKELK